MGGGCTPRITAPPDPSGVPWTLWGPLCVPSRTCLLKIPPPPKNLRTSPRIKTHSPPQNQDPPPNALRLPQMAPRPQRPPRKPLHKPQDPPARLSLHPSAPPPHLHPYCDGCSQRGSASRGRRHPRWPPGAAAGLAGGARVTLGPAHTTQAPPTTIKPHPQHVSSSHSTLTTPTAVIMHH